jgi:hypothetical protein
MGALSSCLYSSPRIFWRARWQSESLAVVSGFLGGKLAAISAATSAKQRQASLTIAKTKQDHEAGEQEDSFGKQSPFLDFCAAPVFHVSVGTAVAWALQLSLPPTTTKPRRPLNLAWASISRPFQQPTNQPTNHIDHNGSRRRFEPGSTAGLHRRRLNRQLYLHPSLL